MHLCMLDVIYDVVGSLTWTYFLYFLVIRATVPKLNLDASFEQKNEIAKAVEEELEKVTCLNK